MNIVEKNSSHIVFFVFRNEVNRGNYKPLERCKSAGALTSAFKMFLRELPRPLLDRSVVNSCLDLNLEKGSNLNNYMLIGEVRKQLSLIPDLNYNLLRFIFLHLKQVADTQDNKMNSSSLAIIFGQNLISNQTEERLNIEGILLEAEKFNHFIELLISFAGEIFTK